MSWTYPFDLFMFMLTELKLVECSICGWNWFVDKNKPLIDCFCAPCGLGEVT